MSITLVKREFRSFNNASIVRGVGKLLESASHYVVVKSSADLFENVAAEEFRNL